jgi:hypothetical protein
MGRSRSDNSQARSLVTDRQGYDAKHLRQYCSRYQHGLESLQSPLPKQSF